MGLLRVEVVYALPQAQHRVTLELEAGATARDAVEASGLLALRGGSDPAQVKLAIFGRAVPPGRRLADGDRVAILRPLRVDPKEARRKRARGSARRRGA
jgi:hypothetical protein